VNTAGAYLNVPKDSSWSQIGGGETSCSDADGCFQQIDGTYQKYGGEGKLWWRSGLPWSFRPATGGQCATGDARTHEMPTCGTNKPLYCGQKGGIGPFGGSDGCDEDINKISCTYYPSSSVPAGL